MGAGIKRLSEQCHVYGVAKRHKTERVTLRPEQVLEYLSHDSLKAMVGELMCTLSASRVVKEMLDARNDEALAHSTARASELYRQAISKARTAVGDLSDETEEQGKKGSHDVDEWPSAVEPYLETVGELLALGAPVKGPESAWSLLMELAELPIVPWTTGSSLGNYVHGDEGDCDWFHDMVDSRALDICKTQDESGNTQWSTEIRLSQLQHLGKAAEAPMFGEHRDQAPAQYRYARTVQYLRSRAQSAVQQFQFEPLIQGVLPLPTSMCADGKDNHIGASYASPYLQTVLQ